MDFRGVMLSAGRHDQAEAAARAMDWAVLQELGFVTREQKIRLQSKELLARMLTKCGAEGGGMCSVL